MPPGEKLVDCFRPFPHIEDLVAYVQICRPRPFRKHVDNLWVLGGEITPGPVRDPFLSERKTLNRFSSM